MRLNGSCHCARVRFTVQADSPVPFMRCYCSLCRKTAGGGGFAINLGARTRTMTVKGQQHLGLYRALMHAAPAQPGQHARRARRSPARRYFCTHCGSALWVWDPRWPELVHPHASAIDTPLPPPPERVHIMLGSKASWVEVEGSPKDARFDGYPDCSLAQWHAQRGLASPTDDPGG